jgi:hypothetical protein
MTEDTPPKPTRRRWRWLVVGVLLFAVGCLGWWYWPGGDRRLVGKWEVWIKGQNGEFQPGGELLDYRSSGRQRQFVNGVKRPRQAFWWTEGDELIVEYDWPTGLGELQERLRGFYGYLAGKPVGRQRLRFVIAKTSASEIQLDWHPAPTLPVQTIFLRQPR